MEPYRRSNLDPFAYCMLRVFSAGNNCPHTRALGRAFKALRMLKCPRHMNMYVYGSTDTFFVPPRSV